MLTEVSRHRSGYPLPRPQGAKGLREGSRRQDAQADGRHHPLRQQNRAVQDGVGRHDVRHRKPGRERDPPIQHHPRPTGLPPPPLQVSCAPTPERDAHSDRNKSEALTPRQTIRRQADHYRELRPRRPRRRRDRRRRHYPRDGPHHRYPARQQGALPGREPQPDRPERAGREQSGATRKGEVDGLVKAGALSGRWALGIVACLLLSRGRGSGITAKYL